MRYVTGIIIGLLIYSCSENITPVKDEDLIPRKEFISILIDLEIMEAYYEQVHKRPQIYKTSVDSASRRILSKSGFSEEMLEKTILYYSAMPDTLYNLYEEALDSLNSMVIQNKNQVK